MDWCREPSDRTEVTTARPLAAAFPRVAIAIVSLGAEGAGAEQQAESYCGVMVRHVVVEIMTPPLTSSA